MSFLLLKQKIRTLIYQPITKKSVIALAIVTSLFFTFQNCSETKFKEMQLASQGVGGLSTCSLDDLTTNSLMMSTSGFALVGNSPSQMTNIPMGSTLYIWMNNFAILESANWFMSYNGGTEVSIGNSDRLSYPSSGAADQGLIPGSYRIRINVKKVCENVESNSGAINKVELAASSTIEKDLIVQFVVTDPNSSTCPTLDNLLLSADDPKSVNTNVNFSVALPTMCRPQATYYFGDSEISQFVGGSSAVHKYELAGQYSSSAQVKLLDDTSKKKSLYKPVIILSECPKLRNVFLSGPSLVYAGQSSSFQLQNFNNNTCNLNIKKVIFKKDGSALSPIESSPFKEILSWQAGEISSSNDGNKVLAEVYLNNSDRTDGNPDITLTKNVRVVEASNQCAANALNSVFISGPRTAMINATLTHTVLVPNCLRESNFESTSIEWALVKPVPGSSEGLLENKAPGPNLTAVYPLAGIYTVKATIKNTKFGQLKISQDVTILGDGTGPGDDSCSNGGVNYPTCSCVAGQSINPETNKCENNSCSMTTPTCSTASPATCNIVANPSAVNQAWMLNATSCGYSCKTGFSGPGCMACTNGSVYPSCTVCPAGQSMNPSGVCAPNSCSTSTPACSAAANNSCDLTFSPSSINEAWVKDDTSCGFACKAGFTGASCNTCSNGAAYPACTICPSGQSKNSSGQCVPNSCAIPKPDCSTSSPVACTLIENATSPNLAWALNAITCGYSCKPGYTGPDCKTCANGSTFPTCSNCPAGQSMNPSGVCTANSCSATTPACSSAANNSCNLTFNPSGINEDWVKDDTSCGFACKTGYTGASCNTCSNGASYPACTTCPAGQSKNPSGQCVANSCSPTRPDCSSSSPVACNIVENPSSINQGWTLNASSCGFSCKPGYTGSDCKTCSNGSTFPACTNCPSGQSMNASGVCTANSCSTSTPACSSAANNSCNLTFNPSSINEIWVKDDTSCGFSCKAGFTGANCNTCSNGATYPACSTCPSGQSLNPSGLCAANSCSASTPVCSIAAYNSCNLTFNPTSINETWVKDDTTCGFSCKAGFIGANCSECSNGAIYPACTTCGFNQAFNASGQCAAKSCSTSLPDCSSNNSCSLTYNPVGVNEAWVKNDLSCGYSCNIGYTGASCNVCSNGANYPNCTSCPSGQSFNASGQCAANSCSASTPACSSAANNSCNLTYNPTSVNESWVLNDSSCGFSCKAGYIGASCNACSNGANYPACSTCPVGQSFNGSGQCATNSCSTSTPACAASNTCSLTYNPSSINESWVKNDSSCGFSCNSGYTGDACNQCSNGANYPGCTSCPSGQAMNGSGQCAPIYCEPRTEQNNAALCQVVTKCADSGRVLRTINDVNVPMAVDIRGEPNILYTIARANVSTTQGEITLWNRDPQGQTHTLKQLCGPTGVWSQPEFIGGQRNEGWCQVTVTVPETTNGCPGNVPHNFAEVNCAASVCEWDGQHYNNSISCCKDMYYCGFGGSGTCRFRNNRWYIENLSCGGGFREVAPISCQ